MMIESIDKTIEVLCERIQKEAETSMYIETVPDVFKAFYQQGMTWEKIAEKTGYSQSPDYPRLYIRDTYLKKCEIK